MAKNHNVNGATTPSPLEKAAKKMAAMLRSVRGGGHVDCDADIDRVLAEYAKAKRQMRFTKKHTPLVRLTAGGTDFSYDDD